MASTQPTKSLSVGPFPFRESLLLDPLLEVELPVLEPLPLELEPLPLEPLPLELEPPALVPLPLEPLPPELEPLPLEPESEPPPWSWPGWAAAMPIGAEMDKAAASSALPQSKATRVPAGRSVHIGMPYLVVVSEK